MVIEFVFWSSVFIVFYTYLGHPLTLYIIGNLLPKIWDYCDNDYTITIYISAFNEEKSIARKIDNILEQDFDKDFKIYIANDGSTDHTANIVRGYIDSRIVLYDFHENRGKAAMQNEIVPSIESDIVIFSDATSHWPKDTLKKIVNNFKDNDVGCVTIDLVFERLVGGSVERGQGLYWKYERFLRKYGSLAWTNIVASGTTYAIKTEFFKGVEDDVGEDLINPLKVAMQGKRVVFDPEIIVAETSSTTHASEFKMRKRIANRNVAGLVKFWRFLNPIYGFAAYQFFVHKYCRVFCWIPIICAFVSNIAIANNNTLYRVLVTCQIVFYFLSIVGLVLTKKGKKIGILFIPYYFSLLNSACIVGFIQYCKGIRKVTWNPIR